MSLRPIALVTGAGSGIGRAVATAFLKSNYGVVLVGRRAHALEDTIELASADEALAFPVVCDVSKAADVDALFEQTRDRFHRLDVLFNNAGINIASKSLDEITIEEWDSVVGVNLTGSFLCARAAFSLMKNQDPMGGRIINNGSVSARAPRPGSAPYTASKHAITGLTKSISLDGRPFDIACGQIDVGNAFTEMASRTKDGVPQAHGVIAPEPMIDVQHVADTVLQMARLPLTTNIQFVTIMATKMPLVGRG